MNDEQFKALVNKMRQAQKEYFRTRSSQSLERSKKLEREVDQELQRSDRQGELF